MVRTAEPTSACLAGGMGAIVRGAPLARRLAALVAAILCASLLWASAALAHAQLVGTSPQSGSTVAAQPGDVIFEFNQAVGGTLGAVRVYDANGVEVDNLDVSHPGGRQSWMGVGLKPHLPAGTYTATYRVISADTHVVYGGLVFNIGHAGAAPRFTVAGLIDRNKAGEATLLAFGAVRFLDYVSLALGIGGFLFLLLVWQPALSASAEHDERWVEASRAFARSLRTLLIAAVAIGIVASLLGVLLQGAVAAGVSLWSSLTGTIVNDTLSSRFGVVWAARAIVWALLGLLFLAARVGRAGPVVALASTPAATGAVDGTSKARLRRSSVLVTAVGLCIAYLAITPALSGHASIQSPTWLFFPADAIHVLAASVWVGGIACLLFALPAATRTLEGPQRSRLLLAALARFSPLALACVLAIALTGVVQAYIDIRTFEGLFHTTYGALVLVKTGLLVALVGLGWINRARVIPAIERLVPVARAPGGAGVLARRTIRSELAAMVAVLGVTAALVAYTPPIDVANGPFSANARLGPAELELTVEPARVGLNTIHLYLIDAASGTQFTATRELTIAASLPSKGIGPLPLRANLAGPGHYVLDSAELSPGGEWALHIVDRVSEFQEYERQIHVQIR